MTHAAKRIDLIVGARPNFVKVAPVHRALRALGDRVRLRLVHTGQHYDALMSDVFFRELEIPEPDVSLGVGSGEHGAQTAGVMMRYEEVLLAERPDLTLVFGDVNSTVACSLTAAKQGVRIGHVEAGLRSFDRTMPEELNRVVTDHVCDLLFTPSRDADENLSREGIPAERVHLVGNVMIDALVQARPRIDASPVLEQLGLPPRGFGVVTLHRPSNLVSGDAIRGWLEALGVVQRRLPLVFPVHPRTRLRLAQDGFGGALEALDGVRFLDPLPYCDFLRLVSQAALVLTDSGGIQEETTYLGVPCLTARDNTERPITVSAGTNELVGNRMDAIVAAVERVLTGGAKPVRAPELWDGHAAERIAEIVGRELAHV
jgi:UDP-N-acetylglucosamine 2-epimerase (non-hydrolysing)